MQYNNTTKQDNTRHYNNNTEQHTSIENRTIQHTTFHYNIGKVRPHPNGCDRTSAHLHRNLAYLLLNLSKKGGKAMNETLEDLERKRDAVEQDIQALYETLQREADGKKIITFKKV